jgi:CRISPR-associated protein Csd1
MILQALAEYYQRLLDDPSTDIAPLGFEQKAINFLVVLNASGEFESVRDIREGTGARRSGRVSLVPKAVKRTVGVSANLCWDTSTYVFQRVLRCDKLAKLKTIKKKSLSEKKKVLKKLKARSPEQHESFVKKIEDVFESSTDVGIQALLSFLKAGDFDAVFNNPVWSDVEKDGGNISFVLSGETQLICQRTEAISAILEKMKPSGVQQSCSVRGVLDVPAKLHTSIKGVWGAKSAGAKIVSFNLDAVCSYGKKQGYNAPVGQSVEFAYITALNYLLAKDSPQRMQVGDASTVFWAKDPCDFESDFHSFLAPKKGEEAVSYEKIRGLLSAVKSGVPSEEADLPFYVLGLAPNASRISIRFWHDGNVKEIKERVAEHFQDLEIVRAPHDPEFLSLFQLLVSTAIARKSENIPPNLGGDMARAVLAGTAYPRTLFANAILRNKAEQKVTFARASIIKGFLARNARSLKSNQQEVSMALDKTYDNIGYVLGRLFAVLERIQEQAQGRGLNKTIRDTYFGAATSSPLVTFNRLDQLSVHHLAKMRNSGKNTIWLEQLKQEVFGHIPPQGIPAILSLEDQGRFSIGYYHQRQDFFTKKETEDKGEEA